MKLNKNQPNQTMPNIAYTQFSTSGIRLTKADKHTFEKPVEGGELDAEGKPKMQTITYWSIPFEYATPLFDAEGNPVCSAAGEQLVSVGDLLIEGCPVTCNGGIRSDRKGSKTVHSMAWPYDLNNVDVELFCGRKYDLKTAITNLFASKKLKDPVALAEEERKLSCMERVQMAALMLIMETSKEHGLKGEMWQIMSNVSRPISWKKSEDSEGNVAADCKNPMHYVNLLFSESKYANTKTIFTMPDGTVLDWELLRGVKVSLIPVYKIASVTVLSNGQASIKMQLVSAVVTSVEKQVIESTQGATMKALAGDTALVEKLRKQIEALQFELSSQKVSTATPTAPVDDAPTTIAPLPPSKPTGGSASSSKPAEPPDETASTPTPHPAMRSLASMLGRGPTLQSAK